MTEKLDKKAQAYLAQADSWAVDRQASSNASRRTAWGVASAAVIVALCEALALVLLMPLKRVEPYTLLVDRQTGYVQLLKPLNPQLIASDAALTQSFLVQYVIAREGFDIDSVQDDYRKVAAWSSGPARAEYLARMPASNPESPLARYPRTTIVDVAISSVTSLGEHVALVRFTTSRHDAGQQSGPAQSWDAVVRYTYVNKPLSAADRFINPLGFQVIRYRRSAEAMVSSPVPSASPAVGSASAGKPDTAPLAANPFRPAAGGVR